MEYHPYKWDDNDYKHKKKRKSTSQVYFQEFVSPVASEDLLDAIPYKAKDRFPHPDILPEVLYIHDHNDKR